jgi:hypothetical protein
VALDEVDPGPGYTCFGGPGFALPGGTLGGWAPGSRPLEMPDGVGLALPAASRVVMQVHYHPHHGTPEPDRTELGIYLSKEKPARTMFFIPLINQSFTIPPNDSAIASPRAPIRTPFLLKFGSSLRTCIFSAKMNVQMEPSPARRSASSTSRLGLQLAGRYRYREPVAIPTGTQFTPRSTTTSANPRNPNDPPKAVSWARRRRTRCASRFDHVG